MSARKRHSALFSLTVTALIIVFIQILLIGGAVYVSRVIPTLSDNAYENFKQTVKNRKNYIERELYNRWSKIDDSVDLISALYPKKAEESLLSKEETLELLENSKETLLTTLRNTGTTGAFVILNDNVSSNSAHSCLYFVDGNPEYNDVNNNSDLLILKGPIEFLNEFKIPLHISWNYGMSFTEENRDIFYKPYNAAKAGHDPKHLGYWHISPSLYDENASTITYSKPLIAPSGEVFGVMGVEVSQEYLFKLLPNTELVNGFYGYAIAAGVEGERLESTMVQGATIRDILPLGEEIKLKSENEAFDGYSMISKKAAKPLAVNYQPISLYDSNSPFDNDTWYLMGITDQSALTKNPRNLTNALYIAIAGSLGVGVVLSVLLSFSFTKPLQELVKQIRSIVPGEKLKLVETGVSEIDELSGAMEQLNADVLNSLLKTDKIIEMVNSDIGSYEYKTNGEFAKISSVLANMLSLATDDHGFVPKDEFVSCIAEIKKHKTGDGIYQHGEEPEKWLKIENICTENGEFGIVVDVTKDELARISLKRERDFDAMTGIYNRFAFWRKVEALFAEKNFRYAAFVLGDLDNLKHLNDTYGHDTGDRYIKATADFLAQYFANKKAVYGRMAGDEFYSFIYGYDTIEEIQKIVFGLHPALCNKFITLPDGGVFRLKMSSGVAWYPADGEDAEILQRYSDFAMYQGKQSIKGGIREFDRHLYQEKSYMFTGKEELNNILDEQLIEYVFQPIVGAIDGQIYGYEALMRPRGKTIDTPDKLLHLAQTEGSLWKVEKNTFYLVLNLAERYKELLGECRLFLNSVPNQVLKEQEYMELAYLHKEILNRLVIEITENERIDDFPLQKKKALAKQWGARLAIDDYGSGYANDMLLINMEPEYIKIDRFLVDGVDRDKNKLDLVKKTVAFAKEHGIAVVAEGIETEEQLAVLLLAEVDYLQGYYVGGPMLIPNFDSSVIEEKVRHIRNRADI